MGSVKLRSKSPNCCLFLPYTGTISAGSFFRVCVFANRSTVAGADPGFVSGGGGAAEILPTSCSRVTAAAKIWASKWGCRGEARATRRPPFCAPVK